MAPHTVKWGIMATGWIAETFCKDILTNSATRDVADVAHKIVAVSSSKDVQKARNLITKIDGLIDVVYYGSYAKLVCDPNVDIIYVATPCSNHFQHTMLALDTYKNILCEKALTVTTKQTRLLFKTARAKNLFFMEAVWTRYFPLRIKVRKQAYLICNTQDLIKLSFADSHRLVNPKLASGTLLDLVIYPLVYIFQSLYYLQPQAEKEVPQVLAAVQKYPITGVNESTSLLLKFPKHQVVGMATTSLRVSTSPDGTSKAATAIRIQGSGGEILVAQFYTTTVGESRYYGNDG